MGSVHSFTPSTHVERMPVGWQTLLDVRDTAKKKAGGVSAQWRGHSPQMEHKGSVPWSLQGVGSRTPTDTKTCGCSSPSYKMHGICI